MVSHLIVPDLGRDVGGGWKLEGLFAGRRGYAHDRRDADTQFGGTDQPVAGEPEIAGPARQISQEAALPPRWFCPTNALLARRSNRTRKPASTLLPAEGQPTDL